MEVDAFDIAQRFVGVREIKGATHNPQILAMLRLDAKWPEGDEVPWCSAFVNYVAWLLRLPRSKSLMARSWLNVGRHVETSHARQGMDVVVLWRGTPDGDAGHVGFYAGQTDTHINLLGGNQKDQVSIAPFPKTQLLGIRRLA